MNSAEKKKARREARGMTIVEAAKLAGVSAVTIHRREISCLATKAVYIALAAIGTSDTAFAFFG